MSEGVHILVIDDEVQIRRFLRISLEASGYHVIEAVTGGEGITRSAQHRPDIIILDLGLPDMDGLEATSRIRAQDEFTHIPIIALTALAMPGDRERCIQAGANEYLSKPVSMKQLVNVIQSHLQETAPVPVH